MLKDKKIRDLSDRFYAQGVYPCPVCRHGEITGMPLMETFACNFCQHIFTTNFEKQILQMPDSQLPLSWRWNGKSWKGVHKEGTELGWGYIIAGLIFVLLPTSIIGLGAYLFPPLTDSSLYLLPYIWTGLTFLAHLICLIWLLLEYYQFPVFLYIQALRRRLSASN